MTLPRTLRPALTGLRLQFLLCSCHPWMESRSAVAGKHTKLKADCTCQHTLSHATVSTNTHISDRHRSDSWVHLGDKSIVKIIMKKQVSGSMLPALIYGLHLVALHYIINPFMWTLEACRQPLCACEILSVDSDWFPCGWLVRKERWKNLSHYIIRHVLTSAAWHGPAVDGKANVKGT